MNSAQQYARQLLRRPIFFQRLQWRLTRNYTLATMLMVMTLQIVFYVATMGLLVSYFRSPQFPQKIAQTMLEATPQLRPHLAAYAQNPRPLAQLMQQFVFDADIAWDANGWQFVFRHHFQGVTDERSFLDERVRLVCVTDAAGRVLAASGALAVSVGADLAAVLPAESRELLSVAQRSETDPAKLAVKTARAEVLAVAPIHDDASGQVRGLFWTYSNAALDENLFWGVLGDFLPQLALVPVGGLLIGLLFGHLTARQLTRRLNRLAQAAERWGQGQLSVRAPVTPHDELGALGERLNQMAQDLESKIALQQTLATMEERNRLARDLHDTIKQQLFACAMQLSAAQRVLEAPAQARQHLNEATSLARQMQEDLTAVIHELAPSDQPQRGFGQALRELTAVWTRQTGTPVSWQPPEPEALFGQRFSPTIELTLLRIVQEALANIARHSQAKQVCIQFGQTETTLALIICDNGQGFDPVTVVPGLGLQNMRERAVSLPGGAFLLRSQAGQGTCLEIRFEPEHKQ